MLFEGIIQTLHEDHDSLLRFLAKTTGPTFCCGMDCRNAGQAREGGGALEGTAPLRRVCPDNSTLSLA